MSGPLSIVIPTWNGRDILERNLSSVATALEHYAPGGEAIVVDDGSRDGTASWLREAHPWVEVIAKDANEGFGAACNAGVAAARSDHVILLNNDMRVDPGFLGPLIAPFDAEADLFASTPRIVNRTFGGDEGVTSCGFRYGLIETTFPERDLGGASPEMAGGAIREVLFACGGAAAFRRDRWIELGGLDPLFAPFYWEDVDISWRARRRGWGIVHVPASVVHHEHSATIGAHFTADEVRKIYERNRLLFQWKNILSAKLTLLHLAWLPVRLVHALAAKPQFVRGFLAALTRAPRVMRLRANERSASRVADERILGAFAAGRSGR